MSEIFSNVLTHEKDSKSIANKIGKTLSLGDIILFKGNLGVGKTFFSKFIIRSIFGNVEVTSPTFNLVNIYEDFRKPNLSLWHCDLYRLNNSSEFLELGIFENLNKKIILIEWPEVAERFFKNDKLEIFIDYISPQSNKRSLSIFGSHRWKKRLSFLKKNEICFL